MITLKYQILKQRSKDMKILITGHNKISYKLNTSNTNLFQKFILNGDTVPQKKIFSNFLLKFFRFTYQLLWEQQDQNAYVTFPKILTEVLTIHIPVKWISVTQRNLCNP